MIVITWPERIPGEHNLLHAMFEQGLEVLHLRKPGLNAQELRAYLLGIRSEFLPRVMLHGGYDLLDEFPCKGIHFSGHSQLRYQQFAQAAITRSWPVHGVDQVAQVPNGVHYILMSPVFPSISKKGHCNQWPVGEPQNHLRERKDKRFRYIALGGIDLHTAPLALDMGFDGFAVLGAIWEPFIGTGQLAPALKLFHELNSLFNNTKNMIAQPFGAPPR